MFDKWIWVEVVEMEIDKKSEYTYNRKTCWGRWFGLKIWGSSDIVGSRTLASTVRAVGKGSGTTYYIYININISTFFETTRRKRHERERGGGEGGVIDVRFERIEEITISGGMRWLRGGWHGEVGESGVRSERVCVGWREVVCGWMASIGWSMEGSSGSSEAMEKFEASVWFNKFWLMIWFDWGWTSSIWKTIKYSRSDSSIHPSHSFRFDDRYLIGF